MFNNTQSFNHNVSKWDVSAVTDMRGMFNNATSIFHLLKHPQGMYTPSANFYLTQTHGMMLGSQDTRARLARARVQNVRASARYTREA